MKHTVTFGGFLCRLCKPALTTSSVLKTPFDEDCQHHVLVEQSAFGNPYESSTAEMNVTCDNRNYGPRTISMQTSNATASIATRIGSQQIITGVENRDSTTATTVMMFEPTKKPCGCVAHFEACLPPLSANGGSVTLNVACGSALKYDF